MKKNTLIILAVIILAVYLLSKSIGRGVNNETHLRKLDPAVQNEFRNFLNDTIKLGLTPVIRDSKRSYKQQAYYKKIDKRNASPGHSTHEIGMGIDVDFYKNGKLVLTKKTPDVKWIFSGVPQLAKRYGMRWGGNFKGYPDNNHFDFLL